MPSSLNRKLIKTVLATLVLGSVLLGAGGFLLMASGFYNIAADEPHFAPVRWFLRSGRTRSVQFHSRGIQNPNVRMSTLIPHGFDLYRENCEPCHGAPGVAAEQKGRGIDPIPPPLSTTANNWTDPQLYWILSHGLKDSGMPAFGARMNEYDRWSVVEFLRIIVFLSPADYKTLSTSSTRQREDQWAVFAGNGYGFQQLAAEGNPIRGRQLLRDYGCPTCHIIPTIGRGQVGSPLAGFSERQYIAGLLVNVPANTVAWIMHPKQFDPQTAMPDLNVSPGEALDMAAYLYTLGDPKRFNVLRALATSRK